MVSRDAGKDFRVSKCRFELIALWVARRFLRCCRFTEDAVCNLGVADWKGREAIRTNLKAFIDTGFTALHDVTEYWDGGSLKVFRGIVTMTPDDRSQQVVNPVMTHFFYMDEKDPAKVRSWIGSVGPVAF